VVREPPNWEVVVVAVALVDDDRVDTKGQSILETLKNTIRIYNWKPRKLL
jgi:hypothetical protein